MQNNGFLKKIKQESPCWLRLTMSQKNAVWSSYTEIIHQIEIDGKRGRVKSTQTKNILQIVLIWHCLNCLVSLIFTGTKVCRMEWPSLS